MDSGGIEQRKRKRSDSYDSSSSSSPSSKKNGRLRPTVAVVKEESNKEIQLATKQQLVVSVVRTGANVFYTGCAGTGKSFLLQYLIREVLAPAHRGGGGGAGVFVTATTGLAAVAIRGGTLHSFAGIGLGQGSTQELIRRVFANRPALRRWRQAKVLVIDEVSMLDGTLFDSLDAIGRAARGKPQLPFGGIQLLCTGDFLQLPPIAQNGSPMFAFQGKSWSECISHTIELDYVFRQRQTPGSFSSSAYMHEDAFIRILGEIRRGICTPEAEAMLRKRMIVDPSLDPSCPTTPPTTTTTTTVPLPPLKREEIEDKKEKKHNMAEEDDGIRPTRLYAIKKEVAHENQTQLAALSGPSFEYNAYDTGESAFLSVLQRNGPVDAKLTLKVGAQVLLVKNISTDQGLVNGSRGVVIGFTCPTENGDTEGENNDKNNDGETTTTTSTTTTASFSSFASLSTVPRGGGGGGERIEWKRISAHGTWPIVRFTNKMETIIHPVTWEIEQQRTVVACRMQVPLILAWSLTIHKCQGMSLDRVQLSLGSVFEHGQAYVALSRVRSLEGLELLDFHPKVIHAAPAALRFYDEYATLTLSSSSSSSSSPYAPTASSSSSPYFATSTTTTSSPPPPPPITATAPSSSVYLICGSRTYTDKATFDRFMGVLPRPSLILSGGAPGADLLAMEWAKAHGIPHREFVADWKMHGKAAGPIRNSQMLIQGKPTHVLAFPVNPELPSGTPGTADMLSRAKSILPCPPLIYYVGVDGWMSYVSNTTK